MHYANGREAKVGDLVKGKGYNYKHEIIGLLIEANPGQTACNCKVATITKNSQVLCNVALNAKTIEGTLAFYGVIGTIEYGQLDAFVAINPETGEVMPEIEEGVMFTNCGRCVHQELCRNHGWRPPYEYECCNYKKSPDLVLSEEETLAVNLFLADGGISILNLQSVIYKLIAYAGIPERKEAR